MFLFLVATRLGGGLVCFVWGGGRRHCHRRAVAEGLWRRVCSTRSSPIKKTQTHAKKNNKRHVKPHALVAATALGNRLFILNVAASSSRQWKKHAEQLETIQKSFFVPLRKGQKA